VIRVARRDGILYFLKSNSGILTAVDAKTGTPHYQNQRLDDVPNMFASPVSARGRIYFPGQEGTTLVIKSGPTYEVLAKNTLEEVPCATFFSSDPSPF
jgi:outer membrane protein assembly factor BamB